MATLPLATTGGEYLDVQSQKLSTMSQATEVARQQNFFAQGAAGEAVVDPEVQYWRRRIAELSAPVSAAPAAYDRTVMDPIYMQMLQTRRAAEEPDASSLSSRSSSASPLGGGPSHPLHERAMRRAEPPPPRRPSEASLESDKWAAYYAARPRQQHIRTEADLELWKRYTTAHHLEVFNEQRDNEPTGSSHSLAAKMFGIVTTANRDRFIDVGFHARGQSEGWASTHAHDRIR